MTWTGSYVTLSPLIYGFCDVQSLRQNYWIIILFLFRIFEYSFFIIIIFCEIIAVIIPYSCSVILYTTKNNSFKYLNLSLSPIWLHFFEIFSVFLSSHLFNRWISFHSLLLGKLVKFLVIILNDFSSVTFFLYESLIRLILLI